MTSIENIKACIDRCEGYCWIHPAHITGFDAAEELKRNVAWLIWHSEIDDWETPTHWIADFLEAFLRGQIKDPHDGAQLNQTLKPQPMAVLEAAFYCLFFWLKPSSSDE